jgi:hypothetical protein
VERRQVFDLELVRAEMTEHQPIERQCRRWHRPMDTTPPGAQRPVQYGPRAAAILIYLYAGQFLSRRRTALALGELFGIPLSSWTVAALTARAAGRLDSFLEHVREQIAASDVAGFDKTGFRVEGRSAWVHCARTGKYTLLMVHPRRGRQPIETIGILLRFAGAVHDAWAPYDTYPAVGHSFAARTPCPGRRPSPMPRCEHDAAGPPRPPKRSPQCKTWRVRRSARVIPPRIQPRWSTRSTHSAPRSWPGPARPPPAPGP